MAEGVLRIDLVKEYVPNYEAVLLEEEGGIGMSQLEFDGMLELEITNNSKPSFA